MSVTASVRMYNQQNLGDCFLLSFKNGNKKSWVMIDFGSYKGKNDEREQEIARHIKETVKDEPLHVVLTHQHKDHLSGFVNAKDEIEKLNVDQFWLSFLDDADSEKGKALRDLSTKYWKKNDKLNRLVKEKHGEHKAVADMLDQKSGLDLFSEGQTGGEAISILAGHAKETKFLTPGDHFDLPGMEGEVKVYVLGPPTDFNQLKSMNPKKGEDVDSLAALNELDALGDMLLAVLESDPANGMDANAGFPFSDKYKMNTTAKNSARDFVKSRYEDKDESWRRIDDDWLGDVGRLALYMDTLTNNTSLVLAFELVKTKKVLLFVGDAQIGNWKSWADVKFANTTVTAEDLLKRTVLYKAGHHSSHNATYKPFLDLMNEKELVIMVPLYQEIADSYHFLMGKTGMLQGYNRKAHGRVLRTDTIYQDATKFKTSAFPFVSKMPDIKGAKLEPKQAKAPKHLYIEVDVN